MVDADDYVNREIVSYVEQHPNSNGYKSKTGYHYSCGSKYVTVTPYFGGTMNIMKLYAQDIPDAVPDPQLYFTPEVAGQLCSKYPSAWTDHEIEGQFAAMGRPFDVLPFRSTIYVTGTGDNLSFQTPGRTDSDGRFHPVAFLRSVNPFDKRLLGKRLRDEFGMRD